MTRARRPTETHDEHGQPWDFVLGSGHYARLVSGSDGQEAGVVEYHRTTATPTGWCSGLVLWRDGGLARPVWTLVSREPLTLSPSIVCRTCGVHGWIENGLWRDA